MGKRNSKKALADETKQLVHQVLESGVDCIVAGWPCQDASIADRTGGKGIKGERTGLWTGLFRAIRLVRPEHALLENVAALLSRGVGTVFGDLASIGYDAQWHCIRARDVGLPHERERLYIITNPFSERLQRNFPQEIQGEPAFRWWQDYRDIEELPRRSDLYPSQLCRSGDGLAKRLHGIGNGNPPSVIEQLMKHLKATKGS